MGIRAILLAEKIIDDWLTERKIAHQRSIHYPENKSLTVDFVVGHLWIEFFGLAGEVRKYDRLLEIKRNIDKKHSIALIELYLKDLFPMNRLTEILKI